MLGAAMQCQRRSAAYIACLRVLAHRALGIARPEFLLWKHLVLPCAAVVPLRTDRNLERPHVLGHIDSSDVKGQRGDAVPFPALAWRREVTVPRLMSGAL